MITVWTMRNYTGAARWRAWSFTEDGTTVTREGRTRRQAGMAVLLILLALLLTKCPDPDSPDGNFGPKRFQGR